jgi:hypothetical protein
LFVRCFVVVRVCSLLRCCLIYVVYVRYVYVCVVYVYVCCLICYVTFDLLRLLRFGLRLPLFTFPFVYLVTLRVVLYDLRTVTVFTRLRCLFGVCCCLFCSFVYVYTLRCCIYDTTTYGFDLLHRCSFTLFVTFTFAFVSDVYVAIVYALPLRLVVTFTFNVGSCVPFCYRGLVVRFVGYYVTVDSVFTVVVLPLFTGYVADLLVCCYVRCFCCCYAGLRCCRLVILLHPFTTTFYHLPFAFVRYRTLRSSVLRRYVYVVLVRLLFCSATHVCLLFVCVCCYLLIRCLRYVTLLPCSRCYVCRCFVCSPFHAFTLFYGTVCIYRPIFVGFCCRYG